MIAKVRIAPIEQWCDYPRNSLKRQPKAAEILSNFTEAHIITESMSQSDWCDGKVWSIEKSQTDKLRADVLDMEPASRPRKVCEHMLVMD